MVDLKHETSPVLERLLAADHVLVQAGHGHHEGRGELVAARGAGARRVVALKHAHKLPALVLDEVPVFPPHSVDLEHVTNAVYKTMLSTFSRALNDAREVLQSRRRPLLGPSPS